MRNRRFKAAHRGGPLDRESHRLLAMWAADCAEHVLPLFQAERRKDDRVWRAILTTRAWAVGEATVGAARAASVAAHAAARAVGHPAAEAAARAAGHAVGTAHMADHALTAAGYAVRAVVAADPSEDAADRERTWQQECAPDRVRSLTSQARHIE